MDYDEFLKNLEGDNPRHKSRAGSANAGTTQNSTQGASYGQQSGYNGTQYNSAQNSAYGQQNAGGYNGYNANAGTQTSTYTGESYYEVRDRLNASSYDDDGDLVKGIIGAVIGAMLGIGVWCLIGMAGYIAWIGSLALIGGAYFGYILMAKGIGLKGLIAVAAIVLISVYIGTRLSFSITLNRELNKVKAEYELEDSDIPSVGKIFTHAGDYIELLGVKKDYNKNMALGYLFTVGAAATIVFRRKKNSF